MRRFNMRTALLTDLAFLALIALCFAGFVLLSLDATQLLRNAVMLCVTALVLLITYFTTLIVGLVADAVAVFLFVAYTLIFVVQKGTPVPWGTYFWIAWIPLVTVALSLFAHNTHRLQSENRELRDQISRLGTIDELTNLRNMRAFERDAKNYMNIAKRYDMQLVLIVWRFRYPEAWLLADAKESLPHVVCCVSDAICGVLREEDTVYMLDDDPYLWGTLLFTNPDATTQLAKRVRESVRNKINFLPVKLSEYARHTDAALELDNGVVQFDGTSIQPLALLDRAKMQLEQNARANEKEDVS